MDQSTTLPQPQPGFRSRRSYPSLNHISLTPLTPRFPIDEDDEDDDFEDDTNNSQESRDYFSPRNDSAIDTTTRTYLSSYSYSYSVPGTPGVLSHSRSQSRSASRPRHHTRSKSSTRSTPAHSSDSNLQQQNVNQPLHHHYQNQGPMGPTPGRTKRPAPDQEWMLRTGMALASSAREEKGQSWLVKRESSTSLVSEGAKYDAETLRASLGRRSRPASGRSTPAVAGARSRATSRRNSRHDLAMTSLGLGMTSLSKQGQSGVGLGMGTAPHRLTDDETRSGMGVVPDFVDERVRAEMRDTIQRNEDEYESSLPDEYWDSEDEEDEMDERELQRLTRERGFGLGSWVDRMVEWTLFGIDDWPLSSTAPASDQQQPTAESQTQTQTQTQIRSINAYHDDHSSVPDLSDNDGESLSDSHSEILTSTERPGNRGGWEDAGWLFRVMKRAFI